MKKVLGIVAIALFAFSFASCKKEYTCCYYDDAGVQLGTGTYDCATVKMKKKDMQTLEDDMNAIAILWNGSAKCK